jgi:hypothetical protein
MTSVSGGPDDERDGVPALPELAQTEEAGGASENGRKCWARRGADSRRAATGAKAYDPMIAGNPATEGARATV